MKESKLKKSKPRKSREDLPCLYDYWTDKRGNLKKDILSRNKRKPDVILFPADRVKIFLEMGDKGFLTGKALEDYVNLKKGGI